MPNKKANGVPFYNYSVPAFREWWVACAVNAITGSDGLLDGLFLDATPKIAVRTSTRQLSTAGMTHIDCNLCLPLPSCLPACPCLPACLCLLHHPYYR